MTGLRVMRSVLELPARASQAHRGIAMLAICLVTLPIFWPSSLKITVSLALRDDRYLQIILAPLACLILIFRQRAEIFSQARYSPRSGIPLLSLAMLFGILCVYRHPGSEDIGLLCALFSMIIIWMAGFVLCCGARSFKAGLYPLCCLFLMLPLPPSWMDRVTAGLQSGSAAGSYAILRISGIPVLRHGMEFSLPGLEFQIGPECSGIRSGLALMMVALVAAYVYLRSSRTRSALILLTVPIVIFKNSLRIVVIATLGAYVNRVFLDGPFHHRYGGLLFSVPGIVVFVLALAGLQRVESRRLHTSKSVPLQVVSP